MSIEPTLIEIPMPIETPRLILRNVLIGDEKALFEMKAESLKDLNPWMAWAKTLGTADDYNAVVSESVQKFADRTDIHIVGFEKNTGRMVMGSGLHRMDWDAGYFEIGYFTRSTETGKGYATESTNALVRYAFGTLNAKTLHIAHAEGNDGSARIIEKLGFRKYAIGKNESELTDGRMVDRHKYRRFDACGLPDLDVRWGPQ